MNIASLYSSPEVVIARSTDPERVTEGRLSVYDLEKQTHEVDYPVRWDFGGSRLDVGRDGRFCFVGCYYSYGLAAYSLSNGSEIWRRKDLKRVQSVTAFPLDDQVFCGREGAGHLLDSRTGETLEKPRGVRGVYSSPFTRHMLLSARNFELHFPFGTRVGSIERWTFADLDCCFSQTEVLISESGGPVRCFDLTSLEPLWRYKADRGHFLRLSFCKTLNCFVGVHWPNSSHDRIKRVVRFQRRTGRIIGEVPLGEPLEAGFCLQGTHVFTSDLRLIQIGSGSTICDFSGKQEQHAQFR